MSRWCSKVYVDEWDLQKCREEIINRKYPAGAVTSVIEICSEVKQLFMRVQDNMCARVEIYSGPLCRVSSLLGNSSALNKIGSDASMKLTIKPKPAKKSSKDLRYDVKTTVFISNTCMQVYAEGFSAELSKDFQITVSTGDRKYRFLMCDIQNEKVVNDICEIFADMISEMEEGITPCEYKNEMDLAKALLLQEKEAELKDIGFIEKCENTIKESMKSRKDTGGAYILNMFKQLDRCLRDYWDDRIGSVIEDFYLYVGSIEAKKHGCMNALDFLNSL